MDGHEKRGGDNGVGDGLSAGDVGQRSFPWSVLGVGQAAALWSHKSEPSRARKRDSAVEFHVRLTLRSSSGDLSVEAGRGLSFVPQEP